MISPLCFWLAGERGRKTKTTKLMAGGSGRHEVQLERVNPSPSPAHTARQSKWAKVEDVIHMASGCPRGTHLIRGKLFERKLTPTIV
ncbi:hypothetical protein H5410_030650 [Solanum commersonii]|uniref:Uncharacterized protein n=1 Tax=Solanum commersonii TaxID=4109 RepID=A0A9J5YI02_SOLCO|nr:hypothetical protein H5410_030650 [Solanum commersonii]